MTSPESPPHRSEAAAERHLKFEQIALDHLRNGDETSNPAAFLPLPVRLTAAAATLITALGVVWACVARVPVQVNGIGSFAPEAQVSSAIALTHGVLAYQIHGLGKNLLGQAQIQRNQSLKQYWSKSWEGEIPSIETLNTLSLAAVAYSQGESLVLPEGNADREVFDNPARSAEVYRRIFVPGNTVIGRIYDPASEAQLDSQRAAINPKIKLDQSIIQDRNKRSNSYQDVAGLLNGQRRIREKELRERDQLYLRLESLWTKGYVSTSQLLQEKAVNNSLRNQVLQLDRDQLSTSFSAVDQQQQAQEADLNSLQLRSQLQSALTDFLAKTFLFADPKGIYIISKNIRNGMPVRAGDEILTYTRERPSLPSIMPVFVDAASSQQLSEGMQVLVTPRGISRAQYGGIPGKVVEVSKLPLPAEGIAAQAGGRTLASAIQQNIGPATYLIRVQLEQDDKRYCQQLLSLHCYRWSSRRSPPFPVRLGTLADVQINVEYRRPIEFVMPALRQAIGLVVENR